MILDTQPSAPVTVTVSGHASTNLSVSDASLTFNAVTWNITRTVTVSAQQDPDAVNEPVTLTHSVSGTGEYATVTAADVKVTIEDNDTPGITEAGFAPKGLYHSINYRFRRGRFVLDYEALIWQQPDETPQAWNNADYKYRRNDGFDRYEVQWRSRSTSGGWSAWQEIELSNNPPTHAAERLQSYGDLPNTLRLTEWESRVRLDIEGPGPCEDKEWRVRALYDSAGGEPSRRSDWVITGDYNIEPLELPGRPELNKGDSWLQLEENSTSLNSTGSTPGGATHPLGTRCSSASTWANGTGSGHPPQGLCSGATAGRPDGIPRQ